MTGDCPACKRGLTCTGAGKLDGVGDAFSGPSEAQAIADSWAAWFALSPWSDRPTILGILPVPPIPEDPGTGKARVKPRKVNYSAAITSNGLHHGQVIDASAAHRAAGHPWAVVWMLPTASGWAGYAVTPTDGHAQSELGRARAWATLERRAWTSLRAYRDAGSPRVVMVRDESGRPASAKLRPRTWLERGADKALLIPPRINAGPPASTPNTPVAPAEVTPMNSDLRFGFNAPPPLSTMSDAMAAANTQCSDRNNPLSYSKVSGDLAHDATETTTLSVPANFRFRYVYAQTELGGAGFTFEITSSSSLKAAGTRETVVPQSNHLGPISGGQFQRNGGRGFDLGYEIETSEAGTIVGTTTNTSGATTRIYFTLSADPTSGQ